MNSSSKFASFAPYTPPPDDPTYSQGSSSKGRARPWFPNHGSSQGVDASYQSGGIPTFASSASGGQGALEDAEAQQNQWETRYGLRVDMLAAAAYVLGPVSALVILIVETQNDYVRFHGYQAALLCTPMMILRVLFSLLMFPSWMRTTLSLVILLVQLFMTLRAYMDASRNGLVRFHIPYIGPLAERWVAEE